jgi:exodeoxyribonuclease-3
MAIKIASYNLWNGSTRTYFRLVDFLNAQHVDVVCLQEINGWQDEEFAKLNDFTDRISFTEYQYGNSNSEFKLATVTSLPVISKTVHQDGFWHCVVEMHVKFDDTEVVIFNVHLDPWKEDPRVQEIERLLNKVDQNKPTIITGDFNSLSRHDNYPPDFLETLQKRKFYKFGQDELEYRVTDKLAEAGFVDIAAKLGHTDITAPTPYGESEDIEQTPATEAPARIDYVFANSLADAMVKDFAVIKDSDTDKISDHYPIIVTLEHPEAAAAEASVASKDTPAEVPVQTNAPATGPTPTPKVETPPPPPPENTDNEGELIIKHDD